MKIGIDARFYGGEQSKGLGRYTQKLIEEIAAHDDTNEYVIFLQRDAFEKWQHRNQERSQERNKKNITPVLAPYHWYTLSEQLFMPWIIWKEHVDLMHFPHFNVPLLYRKPFVVTIHDLIIQRFPTERATTLGPLLYKIKHVAGLTVMRHAALNSKHIITVSKFSKDDIVHYYHIDPAKVTVTYEATESAAHACTDAQATMTLQKYQITKPYFLYVGNAYPHKNLEILVDVFAQLKKEYGRDVPWQMVLVGKPDYFFKRLQQYAWSKDADAHVLFPGFVPDDVLPCLYQRALGYIFPSLYEGFGLPPLEAMSAGTPVLAAQTSCLPEILGNGALYFDPKDISGIIDAIKTIACDETVRTQLQSKGYKRVNLYSWKRMMQETVHVYATQTKTQTEKTS